MKTAMNLILAIFLLSFATFSHSLPLSTSNRWIVDAATGERVKMACGNWVGHLKPMLPEGLDHRPVDLIAKHISLMGFNCVRLTWATYMYTRFSGLTVAQSFHNLGLTDALEGIAKYNPQFLGMTVVEAQKAVVEALGSHGVMILLDNHLSEPMWCCSEDDGNGFWGDKYFDPQEWLQGLALVANNYKNHSMVVAMSLRNELRGPLQNQSVWYEYVQKGVETIHRMNPNLLTVVSGLDYDLDFSFLRQKPLSISFTNKLVYEAHRYSFTEGQKGLWTSQPLNSFCQNITQEMYNKSTFVVTGDSIPPAPLFITEFGINQYAPDPAGINFFTCFLTYLAGLDLDWGIWALQGDYYLRNGVQDMAEQFGVLNSTWTAIQNQDVYGKLQFLQHKLIEPSSNKTMYYLLYHPLSGKCVRVYNNKLYASDCLGASRWSHDGDGTAIKLLGTEYCLTAIGDGLPVTLTTDCMSEESSWKKPTNSNFQLANKNDYGRELCLEYEADYASRILTRRCIGLNDDPNAPYHENPQPQWFKLIASNTI